MLTVTTVMDCGKSQESTLMNKKEENHLNIDLTNPENIFDFSVRFVPKPAPKHPESFLRLVIEPPQKLPNLAANYHKAQMIDDADGVRGHNKQRPFQCDQCKKSFTSLSHLGRHMVVHTGEKPYCCRVCGKRFPRGDYILSHIRCHRRDKVHKCSVCSQTYVDWVAFIEHCLTHDSSEYINIPQKTATKKLSFEKKSKNCTGKKDHRSNDVRRIAELLTHQNDNPIYQACTSTVGNPAYSSNRRPATINYLPNTSAIPENQHLAHNQIYFPNQQTFTLFHQKHQPMFQSSLQDFNQPPELIPITSLDYSTPPCTADHYYSDNVNNSVNATMEYSPHKMLFPQDHSQVDPTQPPDLIKIVPILEPSEQTHC